MCFWCGRKCDTESTCDGQGQVFAIRRQLDGAATGGGGRQQTSGHGGAGGWDGHLSGMHCLRCDAPVLASFRAAVQLPEVERELIPPLQAIVGFLCFMFAPGGWSKSPYYEYCRDELSRMYVPG